MDRTQLQLTLDLLSPLGDSLKARSMFGGFGLFVDDTMFAILLDDGIALRSHASLLEEFAELGMTPYQYLKRGFPVTTSYYLAPQQLSQNLSQLLPLAKRALMFAKLEKSEADSDREQRIKDLPNLRLATERMLKKAGITSVDQLRELGASEAFEAIRNSQPLEPKIELLWALEGAIQGTHWSLVNATRRQQLLDSLAVGNL